MRNFLERVQAKPLLGDGAMGTLLFDSGVRVDQCLEALVVEHPAMIAAMHEDYARAGADIITTHTFGANRMRLSYHRQEGKVEEFNTAAVRLAKEVRTSAERDFLIAGNVGPVGKHVAWSDGKEGALVADVFREQIGALVEAGVDLLLFETFSDVEELVVAVGVAKALCALPVVASVSYGADALTPAGQSVELVVHRLVTSGADVIGANCSVGPAQMVKTLQAMRETAPDALLSVTPNAGLPVKDENGRLKYAVGPSEFVEYVRVFTAEGASIVGGCCGTTPAHIAAMRRVMGV